MAGDCIAGSCPVVGEYLSYQPSLGGNAFMIAAWGTLIPVILFLGYRFGTVFFASTLMTACVLEVLGFVGRLLLHQNGASQAGFANFLLGTILGPTVLCAAIFLVLPHVLMIYGEKACSVSPRYLGMFLSSLAVLAFVLELVGVFFAIFGFAGVQNTAVLLAGLAVQLLSLLLFIGTHLWFTLSISGRNNLDRQHATVYQSFRFKRYLMILHVTAALLLGYIIYRLVEVGCGFGGTLAQNEILCMVVDGVVPLLAALILTTFPPGRAFGSSWDHTSPRRRSQGRLPSAVDSPRALYEQYPHPNMAYMDNFAGKSQGTASRPTRPLRPSMVSHPQPAAAQTSPTSRVTPHPLHPSSPVRATMRHGDNVRQSTRKSQGPKKVMVDSEALW